MHLRGEGNREDSQLKAKQGKKRALMDTKGKFNRV